jgi:hypothetical protein
VIGRKIDSNVSTAPELPAVKAAKDDQTAPSKAIPDIEKLKLQIDALKAIGASAFQRWDKRRNYEWQLSISIWTATAAFIGIVLNSNFAISNKWWVAGCVAVAGGLITGFHGFYLWRMFAHTIGDAHILRWAEQKLCETAFANGTVYRKRATQSQIRGANVSSRSYIPTYPSTASFRSR